MIATLAFGLHPVQVEAVSWASGRKDVLALLFAGRACCCHLRADRRLASTRRCRARAFLLAALSKTTVLPLPRCSCWPMCCCAGAPWREALRAQAASLLLARRARRRA